MFLRNDRNLPYVRAIVVVGIACALAIHDLAAQEAGGEQDETAIDPARLADADIERGRELARTHCTRCHIVADFNTVSIGSTPSFQIMVDGDDDYRIAFLSFYALRPHPAFVRIEGIEPLNDLPSPIAEIHLTLDDVDDIAAFAGTLRQE